MRAEENGWRRWSNTGNSRKTYSLCCLLLLFYKKTSGSFVPPPLRSSPDSGMTGTLNNPRTNPEAITKTVVNYYISSFTRNHVISSSNHALLSGQL